MELTKQTVSKAKHTPGPWTKGTIGNSLLPSSGYIPIYTGDPERGWIAEAKGDHVNYGMTAEEMEANAKLIAAAPELLEALFEIMRFADSMETVMGNALQYPNNFLNALEAAREVLKKATE